QELPERGVAAADDRVGGIGREDPRDLLTERRDLVRGDEAFGDEQVGETGLGALREGRVGRGPAFAETVDQLVAGHPTPFDADFADNRLKCFGHVYSQPYPEIPRF